MFAKFEILCGFTNFFLQNFKYSDKVIILHNILFYDKKSCDIVRLMFFQQLFCVLVQKVTILRNLQFYDNFNFMSKYCSSAKLIFHYKKLQY